MQKVIYEGHGEKVDSLLLNLEKLNAELVYRDPFETCIIYYLNRHNAVLKIMEEKLGNHPTTITLFCNEEKLSELEKAVIG